MRYVLVIAVVLLLPGCGTSYSAKFMPDKAWFEDCPIIPPPDRAEFTRQSVDKKLETMTLIKLAQDRENSECNKRLEKARQWYEWVESQVK